MTSQSAEMVQKGLKAIVCSSKNNGKGVPPEVLYNVARRWDEIEAAKMGNTRFDVMQSGYTEYV